MSNRQQQQGRVITRYGAELLVEITSGERVRCTARRKLDQVACGDFVTIECADHGNARLLAILPRKNALTRPDHRHHLKTIAANIDQLLIMMAWRPEPFWELLDRYLIAVHMLDAEAVIIMNKHDLAAQYASETGLQAVAEYEQIGYTLITMTANPDAPDLDSLARIRAQIKDKTNILVGQSGVGKSSLAALLLPDKDIQVGEISKSGEGRHTTTTTTLYSLPAGGSLIDSPGVRDFVLPDMNAQQLREGYREFADFSPCCKFNNCTHAHEPGCQVRAAVDAGKLPPLRYQRYLKAVSVHSKADQ